ncbi:MAG TPA: type 1 glutamine amidotransferase [Candidatus Eisenbacteria bacterium]|nr:type 1 glutamine amidotransferase [Candidatus Eisenbacteria bacterium]
MILCVRNEPSDSLGIAPMILREAGCEVAVLDAFDPAAQWPDAGQAGLRIETPHPNRFGDKLGGLVVFGGEMNVDQLDRYPYLLRVRQLMREAVDRGIPTLGICLGAQLLARAFGAAVTRAPVRELGFVPIWPTTAAARDALLAGLTPGDRFFQWHEDTYDLPDGAILLATGRDVPTQAYRVGRCGWGVQFHPEVDAAELDAWLRPGTWQWGRTSEEILLEARTYLPAQHRRAHGLFGAFARLVSAPANPSGPT